MNFIEKNTKKVALILSLATCACAVTTVYAASILMDGIMAYTKKTEKIKTEWLILDEGTYYLDENGKAVTGWKEINNDTYFSMLKG